jgi:hypothetical protein
VRKSASEALREIVKSDPSLNGKAFGLVKPLLRDSDNFVIESALLILIEIVKTDSSLTN